uniref:Uncharacterized protein n=1 Tax=Cacopsylla melanoneura TaxID=428564 RepID=A0A8D8ZSE5_9HEMI
MASGICRPVGASVNRALRRTLRSRPAMFVRPESSSTLQGTTTVSRAPSTARRPTMGLPSAAVRPDSTGLPRTRKRCLVQSPHPHLRTSPSTSWTSPQSLSPGIHPASKEAARTLCTKWYATLVDRPTCHQRRNSTRPKSPSPV